MELISQSPTWNKKSYNPSNVRVVFICIFCEIYVITMYGINLFFKNILIYIITIFIHFIKIFDILKILRHYNENEVKG